MTRILLITPDFPPAVGGVQALLARLSLELALRPDVEITIVTLGPGPSMHGSSRVVRVAGGERRPHSASIALLNTIAVSQGLVLRPDIVISGHISVSPAARGVARLLGIEYLQWIYCREMVTRPGLTRWAVAEATATLVLSGYAEELLARLGGRPRSTIRVTPGVDPPAHRAELASAPRLITVARLEELYKGHDTVLRALPLLRTIPGLRWVVVGDGPLLVTYRRMARSLGVESMIDWVGAVPAATRDHLLARSWLQVMPSRLTALGAGEGYGLAYAEAASHGVPSIAAAVGGALDVVDDGVTGLLVPPADHIALADAIAELVSDSQRLATMSEACRRWAVARPWSTAATVMGDAIEAGLASGRRGRRLSGHA